MQIQLLLQRGVLVMEKKIRHLEMIQGVISRMANNSFLLKGWAVTLAAGVFALSAKESNKYYFLIAYIPIIIFWVLDAYYLMQERMYRALYNKVRDLSEEIIDFSMEVTRKDFFSNENNFLCCLISVSEITFYIPLALICALIIVIS